jgi:hypothetical protein
MYRGSRYGVGDVSVDVSGMVMQFAYGYVIVVVAGFLPLGVGWAIRLFRSMI